MSKHRGIMIGLGGMARLWTQTFWPPFQDRMEWVALVDVNDEVLQVRGDELQVPQSARFTDTQRAMESVEADFCCIVTPPAFHRQAVELACQHQLHILSEKPIADTWESCVAIYQAVQQAGVKMLVTQNYRYNTDIQTLKKAISELGEINYVMARYASDYRVRNSWGHFRHQIPHSLLVEGGIHHFDQIRHLCQANCHLISGFEWHPGHQRGDNGQWRGSDSFDGEPCALFSLKMDGGRFASYEGNNLSTGKQNSWNGEYYRVECEGGAAIVDADHIVRIEERGEGGSVQVREVENVSLPHIGHNMMPFQFLNWLDGGETPPTALQDNIQSNAMLFAAIQASETQSVVDVRKMVQTAIG